MIFDQNQVEKTWDLALFGERGYVGRSTFSDERGAFRLSGLDAQQAYQVHGFVRSRAEWPQLIAGLVEPCGAPLELTIPVRRIEVVVTGPRGAPLEIIPTTRFALPRTGRRYGFAPGMVRLVVEPTGEHRNHDLSWPLGWSTGKGIWELEATPGWTYLLTARGARLEPATIEVQLEPGQDRKRIELRLRQAEREGITRLHFDTPPVTDSPRAFWLEVRDAAGVCWVKDSLLPNREGRLDPVDLELPAGHYRAALTLPPSLQERLWPVSRLQADLWVRAGPRRDVTLRAP